MTFGLLYDWLILIISRFNLTICYANNAADILWHVTFMTFFKKRSITKIHFVCLSLTLWRKWLFCEDSWEYSLLLGPPFKTLIFFWRFCDLILLNPFSNFFSSSLFFMKNVHLLFESLCPYVHRWFLCDGWCNPCF